MMRDHRVVLGCLGQKRFQNIIETGRNGLVHQSVKRNESGPFHRKHFGIFADEIHPQLLTGGNKAESGPFGLRSPVGMSNQRHLMPASQQASPQGEKGMEIAK